jgi:LmbE family N-acetylglucosaminyl deacetylase
MSARRVLFVFAHQDDEIAAAAQILKATRAGAEVHCVYLTDGGAPAVRDAESLRALTHLGVSPNRIAFLGSAAGIADGRLVDELARAYESLERHLAQLSFDAVFCMAWEGGHHDHDAAHLVALAFAASRALLDRCWEMPLYHGYRAPGPFFRVMAPLPAADLLVERVTLSEGFTIALLVRFYRSQPWTWLGLLPQLFVKTVVLRRSAIGRVDPRRVRERPHPGRLFYERRYHFPYERFRGAAAEFIAARIPGEWRLDRH